VRGKVESVSDRGFGFIRASDPTLEIKGGIFFHGRQLIDMVFDEVQPGQFVEFELEAGPKGPRALNVRRPA